jgi:16S rRNA processing protein RimM
LLDHDPVFAPGRRIVVAAGTELRDSEIEFFRRQHGRAIMKVQGIDTIADAEKWVGAEIRVSLSDIQPLEAGWFYTFQLKGCGVYSVDGEDLGAITDVLDSGGTGILKVEREGKEILIPFARSYVTKIDLDRRRVEVNLPEGLRDLNG